MREDGGGQRAEGGGRGQKAEGGRRRAEGRGKKEEGVREGRKDGMDEKREMGKSHLKFCRLCPGLSITNPTFKLRQLKIIHDQEICDFPSIFFSIVFLSQHFQWCSSLPTERNHDQEISNLFQYTIFFLHGYFKSYQSSLFSLVI